MAIQIKNPFCENEKLQLQPIGLSNDKSVIVFPKIEGAYRVLASTNNYTDNFGFQWNKFVKTQIDSKNDNASQNKVRFLPKAIGIMKY